MEILYVSSVTSPEEFEHTKRTFKGGEIYGMNESGFKFHTLILNGLKEKKDINICSLVGRSVSFSTHKGLFWWRKIHKVAENLKYIHLGFINLPVIKHTCIGVGCFFYTLFWMLKNRNKEKAIIMDAAYVTIHPFVMAAKKIGKCHTTAIFCDIYEYMADVMDSRANEKVDKVRLKLRKIAQKSYSQLDSFIFLTEHMNALLNKKGKPYLVMEGLVDINMQTVPNKLENKNKNQVIMYAGALRVQYGLKNLVEGFMTYKNDNARLWIFGAGDYSGELERFSQIDNRIVFGGEIPLKKAVENEIEATVLVNARPVGMEFTKYSFPSKNMEYMVSGTPILTTKLPGMPQEYYDYIYTIDGDTADDVTKALEKVFENSKEDLHDKGLSARKFVLENKNNIMQAERIIGLLRS